MIDAHHHLWDLQAVHYPWLMAKGVERFFGDPTPIQRDYLIEEFQKDARSMGFAASVHIQVGAEDAWAEAKWIQDVADANPDWPIAQVVFCDLTAVDLDSQLDRFQTLPTVRGVRQIIGRAPGEDMVTGTNDLLQSDSFKDGMAEVGQRGLSFDLQLIPELIEATAKMLARVPDTKIALCHAGSPHDRSVSGLTRWAQQLESLSALPQVRCKLSGLGMFKHAWKEADFRPIIETCLDQFGATRCMFGSNFPVDSLYSDYQRLFTAHRGIINSDLHADIFHNTAAQFYKL